MFEKEVIRSTDRIVVRHERPAKARVLFIHIGGRTFENVRMKTEIGNN